MGKITANSGPCKAIPAALAPLQYAWHIVPVIGSNLVAQWILLSIIGTLAGIFSGLLGVGGGVIMVPALMFGMHMSIQQAIGISLIAIVPTALIAGIRHMQLYGLDLSASIAVAIFGVVGSLIGSQLSTHLSSLNLERIFSLLLLAMAIRMWVGTK